MECSEAAMNTPRAHLLNRENGERFVLTPFLHRHGAILSFDDHERVLLESSAAHPSSQQPGTYIRRSTDIDAQPSIVASGWAYYARSIRNGRRQIFSFILPGDSIGLTGGPFALGGSEIVAVTALVLLDASNIKRALADSDSPNLRMAFYFEQGLQEARLLDHVVQLGQQSSLERTAHLLLELHHRMDRAGMVKNGKFLLPITQIQMGQALGLSLIHMHRTLHFLRTSGLLVLDRQLASLPDLQQLERLAGYDSCQIDFPICAPR
jgi:CRP-like cAMP-binding protein